MSLVGDMVGYGNLESERLNELTVNGEIDAQKTVELKLKDRQFPFSLQEIAMKP